MRVRTPSPDERSKWRMIGRSHTVAACKIAHVLVESAKNPGVTEIRGWGAQERVAVRRP